MYQVCKKKEISNPGVKKVFPFSEGQTINQHQMLCRLQETKEELRQEIMLLLHHDNAPAYSPCTSDNSMGTGNAAVLSNVPTYPTELAQCDNIPLSQAHEGH